MQKTSPITVIFFKFVSFLLFILFLSQCQTTGGSSSPLNQQEEVFYKTALRSCVRTGGTRVVKINGYLHCF